MTFDLWWLAYPLLGLVVGFLAGLLGIGGGSIIVPMLVTFFLAQGFPHEQVLHMALATSMATILFTSVSSLRAHHRLAGVNWEIVRRIAPGILAGTFFGTFIASRLNTVPLAVFFACFLCFVACQTLLSIKPKPSRELPGRIGMSATGLFIGLISARVAIGGGVLSVPFMLWCNVEARRAIGTSAAISFPIALAGTAGYLVNGLSEGGMPPYTLGYIYLPALLLVGAASTLIAPLGVACAHKMPVTVLRKIFAGLLILLAIKMLHGVFG
jgi:uncharacterized membrane protein YfcA